MSEDKTNLKTGDLVKLKSGGPTMTLGNRPRSIFGFAVTVSESMGFYQCDWFDVEQKPQQAIYHADQLQPADSIIRE